ncbi:MAG: FAD-dependent oxidoreductase [Methyloligellaceae bacterium]
MSKKKIHIRGAGIAGLWQALTLARRGHDVTVAERSPEPFGAACSAYAGGMLAPYCEEESAEPMIRDLGLRSIALWRETYPETRAAGSLVVTQPRDRRELDRYARMTEAHERVNGNRIGDLEPELADRFSVALFYSQEAHVVPGPALSFLLDAARAAGADLRFGDEATDIKADWTIDCRGLAARDALPELRGVRGERLLIRTEEVHLERPVRLLHPRFPIYVVPWDDGLFMVGATQIESEEAHAVSVRSALELLSTAYALHPAFGEAEIVEFGAGVRPAFPDNLPRVVVNGSEIYVNGLFRHGFLLAPALAELVAAHVDEGASHPEVFVENRPER